MFLSANIHQTNDFYTQYEGLGKYIQQLREADDSAQVQRWVESFDSLVECPECHGARLNREALHYKLADKNIFDLVTMDLKELYDWMSNVHTHLSDRQNKIASEIIKEICSRLSFLLDVGLDYLFINSECEVSSPTGNSSVSRIPTRTLQQNVFQRFLLSITQQNIETNLKVFQLRATTFLKRQPFSKNYYIYYLSRIIC